MKTRTKGLRRQRVMEAVKNYVAASRSEATRTAYASDIQAFRRWGGRIPTTPAVLARYLAEHAGRLANATLARRVAAITQAHRIRGLELPTGGELVRSTLSGIRRTHRREQRHAKPVMSNDLRKRIRTALGLRGIRDRALLLIGFAGGFRASEIVGLNREDVEFVPSGVVVKLRKSKTDQEGKGRAVPIPNGKGVSWNCPVRVLKLWIKRSRVQHGPLFRKIDRNGVAVGERLTRQVVSLVVKELIRRLGRNPEGYSGHSLRAGFVTSAAEAGVPTWKIRQQTGHKSDQMVQRYIRPRELFEGHALLNML